MLDIELEQQFESLWGQVHILFSLLHDMDTRLSGLEEKIKEERKE
jgi:hypothetical protein